MKGRTEKIDTSRLDGKTPPHEPDQLGKYEIVERIGKGGFGVVYKGFDPFIKRHVAIKTCTSPDRDLRERYFHEAEIAGRLDHPNIVSVIEVLEHQGLPCLVLQLIDGSNLRTYLGERGALTADRVVFNSSWHRELFLDALSDYHWPGNVRELQNVINGALVFAEDNVLTPDDLPANFNPESLGGDLESPSGSLADYERSAIKQALIDAGDNRRRAAEILNIAEATLYRKIKKYGL